MAAFMWLQQSESLWEAEQYNTEYLLSGPPEEEHTNPYFQLFLEITKNIANSSVEQG